MEVGACVAATFFFSCDCFVALIWLNHHVYLNSNEIYNWVVVSVFFFHPYMGKWPDLTNIFPMGWSHQLGTGFQNYRTWPHQRCRGISGCWEYGGVTQWNPRWQAPRCLLWAWRCRRRSKQPCRRRKSKDRGKTWMRIEVDGPGPIA